MAYTYEDKLNFIAELYCPARMIADETGCSWELILAQAAQETGWGEKVLPGTNNVFNIKADPGWKGEKKTFRVWEEVKGQKIWVNDPFRVYGSYLESLRDREAFLKKNPRYADEGLFHPKVRGNLEAEAAALQRAGYATDSKYAAKLKEVFEGRSMRRAIAMAQKRGCGPILPMVEVVIMDGARVAIANARVMATQDGKEAEIATDARGRIAVRITPKSGDLALKVFDKAAQKWIALETVKMPVPVKSITVTAIAPTFTAQTSTREHEKKAPSKPPAQKQPPKQPAAAPAKPAAGASGKQMKMHKVEKGESLASIAAIYKIRYKAIADANGITSPYIIRPDQMLKIPGVAPAAAAKAPAAAASPAAAPKQEDGGFGGISLAELGKLINEGSTYLHTIFFRNQAANPQTDLMHSSRAPWMKFAQDEFEKGVKRRAGKKHDPRILEYFKSTPTLDKGAASVDETPYCAAFVNWCLASAGFKGSNSALAASFAKWGRPTKGNQPALGAVALIKFPGGGHHVTFVAGMSANKQKIATLGGNQGKAHEVSHSHCGRSLVIAYRYPADYPDYDDDYVLHDVASDNAPMTAASTH